MAITRRSFRRVRSTRTCSRRARTKRVRSKRRTSKLFMKRRYKTSRRMKGGDGDAGDSVLSLVKEYAEKGYLKKIYNQNGNETKIKPIKDAILNVLTGLKGTIKDNYGPKLSCPKFIRWRRKECELKKSVGYYWAYKMLLQERKNDMDNDGYYLPIISSLHEDIKRDNKYDYEAFIKNPSTQKFDWGNYGADIKQIIDEKNAEANEKKKDTDTSAGFENWFNEQEDKIPLSERQTEYARHDKYDRPEINSDDETDSMSGDYDSTPRSSISTNEEQYDSD